MPQNRQFSASLFDKKHLQKLSARLRKVQKLIDDAAKKGAAIGARTGYNDIEKDFRFDDFPQARREIDRLLRDLSTALTINAEGANSDAWGMANKKNDAMVDSMLTSAGVNVAKKLTRPWYNKNERALAAFQNRVAEGMNLSKDVWNLGQFKGELELALEMGLGRGKSAAELSRDVRSFLKYPDKLFRRVRDEKGVLRLSRAAEAFHPGQGVYRSSYKNALRLTATETNIAYRTADSKRWQQTDWVLGIRIQVSQTNHPVEDICDDLQGDYPKDFVFTGWHPFCRCFATSILPSPDEFMDYLNASDEERKDWQFDGEVKDVPDSFKGWVQDNEERIANAKSLPYFLEDNPQYVAGINDEIKGSAVGNRVRSWYNHITLKEDTLAEQAATRFSAEQVRNHREVSKIIGIEQGKRMSFVDADSGNTNPKYSWVLSQLRIKTPYNTNCTLAVGVHELRMRGWDVTALPFNAENKLMKEMMMGQTNKLWIDPKTGRAPSPTVVSAKTIDKTIKRLDEQTASIGRYHISVNWKGGGGHAFCIDRLPNGKLRIYDPQSNELNINDWINDLSLKKGIKITRVDNLLINPRAVAQILKKR